MPATVNVNFRTVVHANSGGICMGFPDVCNTPTPGGPVPIPYPNIAKSQDTSMGSSTVTMDGQPIMLKGSCFAISTGDEAGSAGGVLSGTIKGKAEFITYSFDVTVEGKNVCRLADMMLLNNKNTPPFPEVQPPIVVLPSVLLAPSESEAETKDWSVTALDVDDDSEDEGSPPPEAPADGGGDAPMTCENASSSRVAASFSAPSSGPSSPAPATSPTSDASKKLSVQLDKDKVRCGTEVRLQASSQNIDGGMTWQLKQEGKVVESIAGTLKGGSAKATWKSKAQTDKKVEPALSLVGSAGGLNADGPKTLTVLLP